MQRAATWLGGQLKAVAGRVVEIRQGVSVIPDITAAATMQEYEIVDAEGFLVKVVSYDWMFLTSDLPTSFAFRNGAEIIETLNGVEHKYEAVPLGNKPCVERADTSGLLLVVHTKELTLYA